MGARSWTHTEVAEYFSAQGCELLSSEYLGCNSPVAYRCTCGRVSKTIFRQFKFSKGTQRCRKCGTAKANATTKARNDGLHHFQSETFKTARKAVWQDRYGTDSPLKSSEVKERRRQTVRARYGVDSVSQVPEILARQQAGFGLKHDGATHWTHLPASRAKFRQTMLDRYGVPSLAFVSGRSSIAGQRLFNALFARLPDSLQTKCYFAPQTKEFVVCHESRWFKYDFVQSSLRKAIEYNGSKFHPRPDQSDDEVGWCLFNRTRTVREAREHEARKYAALQVRGFNVLVIWDHEVKQDLEGVLDRCLAFLLSQELGSGAGLHALGPHVSQEGIAQEVEPGHV